MHQPCDDVAPLIPPAEEVVHCTVFDGATAVDLALAYIDGPWKPIGPRGG